MKELRHLFQFLKYVKPGWYYNFSIANKGYWVNYEQLSQHDKAYVKLDSSYKSQLSVQLDAAYQAWNRGVMDLTGECGMQRNDQAIPVQDEYRFIRKYFNPIWAVYVLFVRLFSFYNPFVELHGFFTTLFVKRVHLFKNYKAYDLKEAQDFFLSNQQEKVSVIIPTLNRYKYLDDVLNDLEKQDYKNFEVIVCDQTDPVDHDFYSNRKLDLNLIVQEEKALWLARNQSIRQSKGQYILLFDDDSRVKPDWIRQHLACLKHFECDISSGVSLSVVGAKVPQNYSFYRWGDQIDTGNVMLKKSIFSVTGLFDRQFEKQRMGDGEFGLRCFLQGLNNISNPLAERIHLKVPTGGLRQMGSWDAFRTKKWLDPKPVPSVLYLIRRYFGAESAVFMLLNSMPVSIIPYKWKSSKSVFVVFPFIFILSFPFLLYRIVKSWRIASVMLKEGPKIEAL